MKSTSGHYFVGLDHLRAFAALMVFTWHFAGTNAGDGHSPPLPPLTLLSQGYSGVSLFMTLSGYLFGALLSNKRIDYYKFAWNRAIRLLPLLIFVFAINGVATWTKGESLLSYGKNIALGLIKPCWPNGGWSIAVEMQYYAILPMLLAIQRRNRFAPLALIAAAIFVRLAIWSVYGEVQRWSYWTLAGRIDQFLFGMYVHGLQFSRPSFRIAALLSLLGLGSLYYWMEANGGFYANPTYPSPRLIWVLLPTIEAVAYSLIIRWYDELARSFTGAISRIFAAIGCYSYSMYLLHFYFVGALARFWELHVWSLQNIYAGMAGAVACFLLTLPVAWLSYKLIESPWLRLRVPYARN